MGLEKDAFVKFTRNKEYLFEKYVGQGGTGKTALLKDDLLNTYFICKKYEPTIGNDKEDCFIRFIDEIKILYTLSHINIVRFYNYFLYPQNQLGYILMEHIDGHDIEEFLLWENVSSFEKIFIQLIEGFDYLEKRSILHRDIKPQNILVTNDGIVKIIDFGFGKKVTDTNNNNASILLNWPVSELPEEIEKLIYNHSTEIYFLGKMFNRLLSNNNIDNFKYQHIIDKMITTNPKKRIESFSNILQMISTDILQLITFTEKEKNVYLAFATALSLHIVKYRDEMPKFESIPEIILDKLEKLLAESTLERYIQDNSKLIACFIAGNYTYSPKKHIEVSCVIDFYKLLTSKPTQLRKVIINNIIARLNTVRVEVDDGLPF